MSFNAVEAPQWPTTNPRIGGHQPENWQAAVFFFLGCKVFADKFFWSRPFVLVFTFLIDRTFGYVDVRQAATIVTQKEPFLTRPDQPSSSSLARRVCVLCIHPSTTRGKACSDLVLDGRVSEVIGGILGAVFSWTLTL